MAYLATDKDGTEIFFSKHPDRGYNEWVCAENDEYNGAILPKGTIRKFIGRELTWEDEPVELKNEE